MTVLKKYNAPINSSPEFKSVMALGKPLLRYRNNSLASYIPVRYLRLASANLHMLNKAKRAQYSDLLKEHVTNDAVFLDYDDSELCNLAKIMADRYSLELNGEHDLRNPVHYHSVDSDGVLIDKYTMGVKPISDWEKLYDRLNNRLIGAGFVQLPARRTGQTFESCCRRTTSQKFWRRLLRTTQSRTLEAEHVRLGHVSRHTKQLYISNESLVRFEQKRKRNIDLLESLESINNEGYSKSLKDLAAVSTSNPELRRNELMARLRGMEEYADLNNLVGEFYTLTCPSEYHRYSSLHRGNNSNYFLNPLFNGSTPRISSIYLNGQFKKIRAELARRNLPIMGMRVAEPHHDGCPHWHMLFFISKQHRTEIRQVFRQYALEHSPDEKGAKKHRFTAIRIKKKSKNGKAQSAVGYIAKYISKNLSIERSDNHKGNGKDNINGDFLNDGVPVSDSILRVSAWASLWGIRQFQQIGGERITVWRELRRLRSNGSDDNHQIPDVFKNAHKAADLGNYCEFLEACIATKKIEIVRKFEQLPDYSDADDLQQSDRLYKNVFNEFKQAPIIGLRLLNIFIQTRLYEWETQSRKISIFYKNEGWQAATAARHSSFSLDLCH